MSEEVGPGRIIIDLFSTLDGVIQGPGGEDEDPSGGFPFSGWQQPVSDEFVGSQVLAGMTHLDALLLGRRTYDIFAAYWPSYAGEESNPIATLFNQIPKYVASRGAPHLSWEGSTHIQSIADVAALRDRHRETHVIGSANFAQTLFAHGMFDELKLWIFPVVLGQGKRVFPEGTTPATLRLIEPAVTSPTGVILLRYAQVSRTIARGTFDEYRTTEATELP